MDLAILGGRVTSAALNLLVLPLVYRRFGNRTADRDGQTDLVMSWLGRWRERAADLRREVVALYLAVRDARCPWYARALAAVVIAYALSPIDLIPDFIPVLGLLDDLVLVPLGILAVRRLIPAEVLDHARRRAGTEAALPASRLAGAVIIVLWLVLAVAVGYWVW